MSLEKIAVDVKTEVEFCTNFLLNARSKAVANLLLVYVDKMTIWNLAAMILSVSHVVESICVRII